MPGMPTAQAATTTHPHQQPRFERQTRHHERRHGRHINPQAAPRPGEVHGEQTEDDDFEKVVNGKRFPNRAPERVQASQDRQREHGCRNICPRPHVKRPDEEQDGGYEQEGMEPSVHEPVMAVRKIEERLDLRNTKAAADTRRHRSYRQNDAATEGDCCAWRISMRLSDTCTGTRMRSYEKAPATTIATRYAATRGL